MRVLGEGVGAGRGGEKAGGELEEVGVGSGGGGGRQWEQERVRNGADVSS